MIKNYTKKEEMNKPMTVNERNVYKFLTNFIPKDMIKINDRTTLFNPISKKFLELDFYIPSLKIGIEVQGVGHEYKKQRERDLFKYKLAKNKGIKIFYVIAPISTSKLYTLLNAIIKKINT